MKIIFAVSAIAGAWLLYKHFSNKAVANAGQTAFFEISPGVNVAGTINSTGGFTEAQDPNGIGGGFAT